MLSLQIEFFILFFSYKFKLSSFSKFEFETFYKVSFAVYLNALAAQIQWILNCTIYFPNFMKEYGPLQSTS